MTRKELVEHLALLKEQARNSGANTFIWDISQESFNFVIDSAIKALEQEPKTGHWISRPHIYGVAFCSECGFELKINNTNYCPNCGCRMVEPQETEET